MKLAAQSAADDAELGALGDGVHRRRRADLAEDEVARIVCGGERRPAKDGSNVEIDADVSEEALLVTPGTLTEEALLDAHPDGDTRLVRRGAVDQLAQFAHCHDSLNDFAGLWPPAVGFPRPLLRALAQLPGNVPR